MSGGGAGVGLDYEGRGKYLDMMLLLQVDAKGKGSKPLAGSKARRTIKEPGEDIEESEDRSQTCLLLLLRNRQAPHTLLQNIAHIRLVRRTRTRSSPTPTRLCLLRHTQR